MQTEGQERPFHHIFETMSDGIILTDIKTGQIVEANPAASTLHGCSREEFIGQPLTSFIHPDNHAQVDDWVTAVVMVLISDLDARQQAVLSAGADSFISKGDTPDRVAECLQAAANNHSR